MRIFDKDCPLCGSELPVSADSCGCGFSFEPTSLEETAQELEMAVQDEQLYSNYLSARVSQTKEAIDSARIVLKRTPENPAFQNDLKNAEVEYKTACSEHNAQTEKLAIAAKAAATAKETLEKARAVIELQKEKSEAKAKQEAEEARLRSVARAQAARESIDKEEARAKRIAEKQAKVIQKQAQEILGQDKERLSKRARRAARAAHERQVAMAMALVSRADDDIKEARKYTSTNKKIDFSNGNDDVSVEQTTASSKKSAKQIQSSVVVSSATNEKQKKTSQKKSNRLPVITKKPNLVFKARQAIKAAAALMSKANPQNISETESMTIQSTTNVTSITEKMTKLATPEFKSKQRRDTDRLQPVPKLVHNAKPTCPHCTAEIDMSSNKCKCGFVLEPLKTDGFELMISDADKEAMDAFSYISITKMS